MQASSERYKTSIAPLAGSADKLQRLRPVSFHLKSEPHGAVQYGLIAEEVERVCPELVIRDDSGKIQGVRYDELASLLLSEAQQQRKAIAAQNEKIDLQGRQLAELKEMNRAMQGAILKLTAEGGRVAMR